MTLRGNRCMFGSQRSATVIVLPIILLSACLILGALTSPQAAYAYTHWFKMYDINMNELSSGSEIDVNELQQGFCLEVLYDGSDGSGLGWPLAYLNIFVDEASDGKTSENIITFMGGGPIDSEPVVGNTSEVALLKVYDDDRIYDGEDQYGNPKLATNGKFKNGAQVFTGVIHRLYRVKFLKNISPDTDLEFQFSLIGYSHGIKKGNQEGIVRYSIAVQGSAVEEEKEDADKGASSPTTQTDEPSENQSEAHSGDVESIDQCSAQPEEQGKKNSESTSTGSKNSAQTESSRLSSNRQEDSATDENTNIPKSGNGIKVPGATAEIGNDASDDGGGVAGAQKAKREEDVRHSRGAMPARTKKNNTATSALSRVESGKTSVHDAPYKESGVLFELKQNDPSLHDSSPADAAAQVKLTGIPYLYFFFVGLLVAMIPLGGLSRAFCGRLAVRSRLMND